MSSMVLSRAESDEGRREAPAWIDLVKACDKPQIPQHPVASATKQVMQCNAMLSCVAGEGGNRQNSLLGERRTRPKKKKKAPREDRR